MGASLRSPPQDPLESSRFKPALLFGSVPSIRSVASQTRQAISLTVCRVSKRISASDAKNNFGGLLEDVAALGRVDIVKHGRLVAVVLSPRTFDSTLAPSALEAQDGQWGMRHMIPPEHARAARMLNRPSTFDEE
jgi:prevent-host-death family protein